jgi:cytochrome c-type biogenesis protein CcsB
MAMRWVRLGHGPYLGYFELTSALTFFTVLLLVGMAWRYPRTSSAGIVIMPVALLLIGAAMTAPKGGLDVGPTLASYWLFIHVVFSDLAFGAFVVSFGLAVAYVMRARSPEGPWARKLSKLPDQETVDRLSGRFVVAGFLFWGIMIASGAIWANEAWGRYWAWDPIETWSLVVWIIYAVYLHLRLTLGWRGEKIAWYAIIAMPVAMFCLAGIPFIYKASIHTGYLAS